MVIMSTDLILGVIFSILLVIDIVGNTLVILLILKYPSMKTPMNYLLLNLAVADAMVGTFFAPQFLFEKFITHPTGTVGDVLCKTLTGKNFSWIAALASGFTLVYVAVERFYAVVHPTKLRHKITKQKLKQIVPVCWIIATLFTMPSLVWKSSAHEKHCQTKFSAQWHHAAYDILWLVIAGIVPVTLMTVLYSRIIFSLRVKNGANNIHLAVINSRKRIIKKAITVSIIYALCVLPTNIFFVASRINPNIITSNDIFLSSKTAYCLLVLNSSVNPFVYTFQCAKFRKCLKKLVC